MSNSLLHPFSLPEQAASDYVNIVRGEGSIVFDDSGKAYVDGLANLWLCQVGNQKIMKGNNKNKIMDKKYLVNSC